MELRAKNAPQFVPRPATDCAQCGSVIYTSSWSEFVDDRRIRDLWECHACGYTFETEVVFPALRRAG
jgi:transcription elongation factor Elf1